MNSSASRDARAIGRGRVAGLGQPAVDARRTGPGLMPQVTVGAIAARVKRHDVVVRRAGIGRHASATTRRARSNAVALRARTAVRAGTRTSSRRDSRSRRARRLRWTCCRSSSARPSTCGRSRRRRIRRRSRRRPCTPRRPMIVRITSFAYTPGPSVPFTSMRRTLSGDIASDCDASTSRTCDVPMPNAIAPNAPCVDVWLSPQQIVMPGCVSPSSGPMTWTMPCDAARQVEQRDAVLAAVALERRRHALGHQVGERPRLRPRRHDVIDGRERALRRAHRPARARAARRTPAGSSLRGRDAGRCRAASGRSAASGRCGDPRLSERAFAPWLDVQSLSRPRFRSWARSLASERCIQVLLARTDSGRFSR